jgi:hypothetical protein
MWAVSVEREKSRVGGTRLTRGDRGGLGRNSSTSRLEFLCGQHRGTKSSKKGLDQNFVFDIVLGTTVTFNYIPSANNLADTLSIIFCDLISLKDFPFRRDNSLGLDQQGNCVA